MWFLGILRIMFVLCLGCLPDRVFAASRSSSSSSNQLVGKPVSSAKCPVGYEKYGTVCFHVSKGFSNYATAESNCMESGGMLAAPKNAESQSGIAHAVEKLKTASYWIGLKRVKNVWKFSDGTLVSAKYGRWHIKHPMTGSAYECGSMNKNYNHAWVSTECEFGWRRYVCQSDLIMPTTTTTSTTTTTEAPTTTTTVTTAAPPLPLGCEISDLHLENMFAYGRPFQSVYEVGSVLSADCLSGYASRVQPPTVECTSGHTWNTVEPCVKTCSAPVLSNQISSLDNTVDATYMEGDVILLACPVGLSLEGDGRIRCLANGTWSNAASFGLSPCIVKRSTCMRDYKPGHDSRVGGPTAMVDNEFLKVGQSVSLSCVQNSLVDSSRSAPTTQWTWMKDQHILETPTDRKYNPHLKMDERGSLHIHRMSSELEGLYTCVSTVDYSEQVNFRSVYVAVTTNCSLALDVRPQDTVIAEKSRFILRCSAPNAIITWSKGELPLIENDDHRVLPNGALLIQNARWMDTGTYRCTAQHVKTRCQVAHSVSLEVESSVNESCGTPMIKRKRRKNRGKIVGGYVADRGSHPWLALVVGLIPRVKKIHLYRTVFCGGSLLNHYWVLTAAHCLVRVKQDSDLGHLNVFLGKHEWTIIESDERAFTVQRKIIHPLFDSSTYDNDIALLRLRERVYYSTYIIPVCLPTWNFMSQFQPIYRTEAAGHVAGWGRLKEDGLQPLELMTVKLPLISDELCRRSTASVVTQSMFCAGYNITTAGVCNGDSGGPFEMFVDGKAYLAGIVSWRDGCATPRNYSFFTKVENFLNDMIYPIWNE